MTKKKKDKLELTKIEERLLLYPPTETTWKCSECDMNVPGTRKNCFWCQAEKSDKSKLIFPLYLRACEKVGIIPHSCRWKYKEGSKFPIVFPKDGHKWIAQEEFQKSDESLVIQ